MALTWNKYRSQQFISPLRQGQKRADWVLPSLKFQLRSGWNERKGLWGKKMGGRGNLCFGLQAFPLCQSLSSFLWTLGPVQRQWEKQPYPTGVVPPPPQVPLSMPDARWKLQANQPCHSLAPKQHSACSMELPPCDSFHSQAELCLNLQAEIPSLIFHSTDVVSWQNRTKLLILISLCILDGPSFYSVDNPLETCYSKETSSSGKLKYASLSFVIMPLSTVTTVFFPLYCRKKEPLLELQQPKAL